MRAKRTTYSSPRRTWRTGRITRRKKNTDEKSKAKFEFKKRLDEIKKCGGRGTELISLYIPPSRQIHEAVALLRTEGSESSNIKSRLTRNHVLDAIESMLSRLKLYKSVPQHGMALFVGHNITGNDTTDVVQYIIELPEPIALGKLLYRCDSVFYTEPLEELTMEQDLYGMVVIDRNEATIGMLSGKRVIVIETIESMVPNKHTMGGQSQARYQRITEHEAHKFFKKIAEMCIEEFLNKPIKGILVGGPGPTKDFWLKEEYLHHELRKKVIGPFDTGYTDETGLREMLERAEETLAELALIKEKKLIERFKSQLALQDGGLAEYGKARVEEYLSKGMVSILILSESLDPKEIERLNKIAENYNTTVELVSEETEQGKMVKNAFNGIVAILRYRK